MTHNKLYKNNMKVKHVKTPAAIINFKVRATFVYLDTTGITNNDIIIT